MPPPLKTSGDFPPRPRYLLVDGDWLLYSTASALEVDTRWDADIHTLHSNARALYDTEAIKKGLGGCLLIFG
jgi:hypothetical protein